MELFDASQLTPKRSLRRGFRLKLAAARGRSHFLGSPLLAPGAHWPHGPNGPLTFLTCLDFADVQADAAHSLNLPDSGVLNVFYDAQAVDWSFYPDGPLHWKLIYETGDVGPLNSSGESTPGVPFTLVENAASQSDQQPRHQLAGEPFWIQGDQRPWLHFASGKYREDPNVIEALRRANLEPEALMTPDHQIRLAAGRALDAANVPPDVFKPGVEQWQLLLQIDSDEALSFCWGDVGTLYVMLPKQSLAARRFDDAWICMQCH
jgi:hypothetical protein